MLNIKFKGLLLILLTLSLLNCATAYSENSSADASVSMKKPYLLLVYSSYENQFDRINSEKLSVFNQSPYDGIALRIINEFDDSPIQFDKLKKNVEFIKNNTPKTVWPWVFLNRMIGTNEKEGVRDVIKKKSYFLRIKGMDIYDEEKTLTDFYELWRHSLRIAKTLSSPGVVFDMEPYNNSKAYNMEYLVEKHGKTSEEIQGQLRSIGEKLTEIASEEYPDAVIWYLFTYMGYPVRKINPFSADEFYTVSYIAEGMVLEAEKRKLPMKFIDGGEVGLGYCFKSLEDMQTRMKARQAKLKPVLENHPQFLLGGTIAPWNDVKAKRGWMDKGVCSQGNMKTIDDFIPLFRAISSQHDYIWVYATPVAGYNPFDKEIAAAFNKGLRNAFQK